MTELRLVVNNDEIPHQNGLSMHHTITLGRSIYSMTVGDELRLSSSEELPRGITHISWDELFSHLAAYMDEGTCLELFRAAKEDNK